MPNISIPEGAANFLRDTLFAYTADLQEIRSSIQQAARAAGLDPDAYVPDEINTDLKIATAWENVLTDRNELVQLALVGTQVPDRHVALMHSALMLKHDELIRHLQAIVQDPLAPDEARIPLAERITSIEQDIERTWGKAGISQTLNRVRERRAMRRCGPRWERLAHWLEGEAGDSTRVWCFCDTTFFLESKDPFDQVDWAAAWNIPRAVLAVPPAMLRELDEAKSDPRRDRSRRRRRAVRVLQVLEAFADATPIGIPALVKGNVEVLIIDHDSPSVSDTLDLGLPDDRLIAAALDFRNAFESAQVVVVSDDLGPRHKARRHGLGRRALGPHRRPLPSA